MSQPAICRSRIGNGGGARKPLSRARFASASADSQPAAEGDDIRQRKCRREHLQMTLRLGTTGKKSDRVASVRAIDRAAMSEISAVRIEDIQMHP